MTTLPLQPWQQDQDFMNLSDQERLFQCKAALDYAMTQNLAMVSTTANGVTVTRDQKSMMEYIKYLEARVFRQDRCNGITIIGTYC